MKKKKKKKKKEKDLQRMILFIADLFANVKHFLKQ